MYIQSVCALMLISTILFHIRIERYKFYSLCCLLCVRKGGRRSSHWYTCINIYFIFYYAQLIFSSSWLLFFLNNKNTAHRYVYIDTGILEVTMMRTEKKITLRIYITQYSEPYVHRRMISNRTKGGKDSISSTKTTQTKVPRALDSQNISTHRDQKRILYWELTQPRSINWKKFLKSHKKNERKKVAGVFCVSVTTTTTTLCKVTLNDIRNRTNDSDKKWENFFSLSVSHHNQKNRKISSLMFLVRDTQRHNTHVIQSLCMWRSQFFSFSSSLLLL